MTVTNPTLAGNGSKVFASSSTATLTLYGVQSEVIRKSANLIDMPMPVSDSNAKLLFDLMGTSREITIEGIVTINDVANLYYYAQDLAGLGQSTTNPASIVSNPQPAPANPVTSGANFALIFGGQGNNSNTAGYVYTPYTLNMANTGTPITILVYVNDVQITGEAGNTNSFKYTISLMECSGSSST